MSSNKPALQKSWIDPSAHKIVQILQTAGFQTFLVGGCVRDLLAGIHPKDFDIATSALPNDVKRKVPGSYIIGKRFRLVLVKRGEKQFEVATFRRNIRPDEMDNEDNPVIGDNYFGTNEEDARRRDFTINALFYDPIKDDLIDFVGGKKDVEARVIRMIGDPVERFVEDPIRMLRAIRLSHKLDFSLEPELRSALEKTSPELQRSVLPRRREEWLKILRLSEPARAFSEMYDLGVLKSVFPTLHALYEVREKLEIFEELLARISKVGVELQYPEELFSAFVYAYIRAMDPTGEKTFEDWQNDADLERMMRDELGMFRIEGSILFKTLDMFSGFARKEAYLRKGFRRQQSFIRNDGLSLALRLSQIDGALSEVEFHFWLREIEKHTSASSGEAPAREA